MAASVAGGSSVYSGGAPKWARQIQSMNTNAHPMSPSMMADQTIATSVLLRSVEEHAALGAAGAQVE